MLSLQDCGLREMASCDTLIHAFNSQQMNPLVSIASEEYPRPTLFDYLSCLVERQVRALENTIPFFMVYLEHLSQI